MTYKIKDIQKRIAELSQNAKPINIMEVCGTHTSNIRKYGIRQLLPDNINLISGPGCPVCVTAQYDIGAAISISNQKDVIFTCFGDMMRVPCGDTSLYSLYENGKDIRIVTSPIDVLSIAEDNPDKQVVYFGIGFETTSPLTAALIEAADKRGIYNLSVLCAHKTMPQAILQLLKSGSSIDALLCPGHVAAITGAKAFSFIADELGLPAAVAGFEAYDIMAAILCIIHLQKSGEKKCVNMYPRAVSESGNKEALSLMYKVFEPCDAIWRGLGNIKGSALRIKERYKEFDALKKFNTGIPDTAEAEGCICALILCGKSIPTDCANFGRICIPDSPLGACMVSSEGSCAAYYRYGGEDIVCRRK
jgi:hydrogenase expression/formation protein HypD